MYTRGLLIEKLLMEEISWKICKFLNILCVFLNYERKVIMIMIF